eukprot:TRINITY_DN5129_c0_g3_i3.p1 TRINITY_DN5129_c0_g3~~TRINITY_DN5129_c0_g3_i3.p1  ORF type:complete len:624 (-),score=115.37 TRINITY_DN5129_c0_g3_i3:68-1939(-)
MKSITARAATTHTARHVAVPRGGFSSIHTQQRFLSHILVRGTAGVAVPLRPFSNERCSTAVLATVPLVASHSDRHYARAASHYARASAERASRKTLLATIGCGAAVAFGLTKLVPLKQEQEVEASQSTHEPTGVSTATATEPTPTPTATTTTATTTTDDLHETVGASILPSRFPFASLLTVHADTAQSSGSNSASNNSLALLLSNASGGDGAQEFKSFPLQGQANVYKIVLTGGPCGGKSTALSILGHRLTSLGFRVYSVPEAATILFTGGGRFAEWDIEKEIAFEESKIRTQMALEDAFMQLARVSGKPSVVICDRGTVDSKAYIADDAWNLLLNKTGWSIVGLRDKQYDAVLHLISAALGAESFYQTVNNPTRTESLSGAKELDLRILNAWIGHPRLYIIDNSTDFKGKMDRVMEVLCRQLGIMSSGTVRKFLLRDPKDFYNIPVQYEEFDVEQTFLRQSSPGTTGTSQEAGYVFIQKRGQHGVSTYRYSTKLLFPDSQEKAVIERQITGVEYLTLLKQADPTRHVVKKKVRCFLWNHRYYELSSFASAAGAAGTTAGTTAGAGGAQHSNGEQLVVLYTDGPSSEVPSMPPFLSVTKEVTADRRYSSYTLAHKHGTRDSEL